MSETVVSFPSRAGGQVISHMPDQGAWYPLPGKKGRNTSVKVEAIPSRAGGQVRSRMRDQGIRCPLPKGKGRNTLVKTKANMPKRKRTWRQVAVKKAMST